MKQLIQTLTLSQAQSVRIALETAQIPASVSGQYSVGALGGGFSVYVLNDADEPRARSILADLTSE